MKLRRRNPQSWLYDRSNPYKFTQTHLKILAEHSSPSEKKAWRLTEKEQEELALRLLRPEDKREVDDPRAFERKVRETVNDRRQAAREDGNRRGKERDQAGVLRDFLKLMEKPDTAIRALAPYDFSDVKAISKTDKHRMLDRLFELSEIVASVASDKISVLREADRPRKVIGKSNTKS